MKNFIWIMILVAVGMISCSRSAQHRDVLSKAERIVSAYPDSALCIVEEIDPKDLKEDSLRALYAIVVGTAHKASDNSMVADSLTRFAFEYYRDKNFNRFLQAGDLFAMHRFWLGDGSGSLSLLDSLIALPNIPKDVKIELLRSRMGIGGAEFDCKRNIRFIKELQSLDTDSTYQAEYLYQLCENYQFAEKNDSALIIIDELVDYARRNHLESDLFTYTYEKVGILEELGRYEESNRVVDYILEHAPHNSAIPYLRFWKALNYFNLGDIAQSQQHLAYADSCAFSRDDVDIDYYESFAGPLREFLKYRKDGSIGLSQLAIFNNSQRNQSQRMESTRLESEKSILKSENRALTFKSQSERKTYIIVIVSLVALILVAGGVWLLQKRKRKTVEAEERAETLQRMIDELQKPSAPTDNQEALRRAMLQQLNIIKMVAETPTEQNREMLRKISSVDNNADGPLINWANVYEIVDNLHYGFYSKLQERYGDTISEKEVQAIVLLAAGFSAKEISVITSQSAASVYVRKSSVKKKLGVPEKEDVIAFLRQELSC